MLHIPRENAIEVFSKDVPPAARCHSGDSVVFHTRDAYDDQCMRNPKPLTTPKAMNNPSTGPLYIEEAMPGDTLKIEIKRITLEDEANMLSLTHCGAFVGMVNEERIQYFDLSDGKVHYKNNTFDMDPMLGVIGVAPAEGEIDSAYPGTHGGNMDCTRIAEGATLYLPVNVEGALLVIGDVHALMGDGEVLICGLEARGEVEVKVTVLKDADLPLPFLERHGVYSAICSADTLDEAASMASKAMLSFVMKATGFDVIDAGYLLSLKGNLAICQIVDPLKTVRMDLDKSALDAYGYKLP